MLNKNMCVEGFANVEKGVSGNTSSHPVKVFWVERIGVMTGMLEGVEY